MGLASMTQDLRNTYTLMMRQLEAWKDNPHLHLDSRDQRVIQLPKSRCLVWDKLNCSLSFIVRIPIDYCEHIDMSVIPLLGHLRYLWVLQLASSWQSQRVEVSYNFIPMWISWIFRAVPNGTRCLNLGNCVCQCPYQYFHFGYLHLGLCTWIWIMPNRSGVELRYKTRCPDSHPLTLTELGWTFIHLGNWLLIIFIPEPPELIVLTLGGNKTKRKFLF